MDRLEAVSLQKQSFKIRLFKGEIYWGKSFTGHRMMMVK